MTTRRLVALINGLPEGSALHRARNEGRTWTTDHALLWHLAYMLQRVEGVLGAQGVRRQPKPVKKKKTPWDDDTVKRTGRVEKGDELAAIRYLQGLSSGASDN